MRGKAWVHFAGASRDGRWHRPGVGPEPRQILAPETANRHQVAGYGLENVDLKSCAETSAPASRDRRNCLLHD